MMIEKFIKARKNHLCLWCGEVISKGSEYCSYYDDLKSWSIKTKLHPECREALLDTADYYDIGEEEEWIKLHWADRGISYPSDAGEDYWGV